MQQALEALEEGLTSKQWRELITALRERLAQANEFSPDWDAMAVMVAEQQRMAKRIEELEAQPEQEPVAWMTHSDDLLPLFHKTRAAALNWQTQPTPLYTATRQWQGLTEIEFRMLYVSTPDYKSLWQAIEAKLKEKNNA
jgi:hypothetical protein